MTPEEMKRLMDFYAVETLEDLIQAMDAHIKRLQQGQAHV